MRTVVGLGNPGERYRRTRHNVGFMVVDVLAARAGVDAGRTEHDAWVAETKLAGQAVILVKPLGFMNRSGAPVAKLLGGRGWEASDLIVVEDDIALPLGTLRVRARGGHGGHNGLRSIIDTVGSGDFPRIRVGIQKGDLPADLAEFVLSDFPEEDVLVVQDIIGRAADAVECVLGQGVAEAMNRFNGLCRV
jgi:PTH1 family peptidyl-tRNA hydrolase